MRLTIAALALVGCTGGPEAGRPVVEHPPVDGAAPEGPTLVPGELSFTFLPINSVRGEVSGQDAASGLCVHVIWDFSNNRKSENEEHCDDFSANFPYVTLSYDAECGPGAGYWGTSEVVSASGCVHFAPPEFTSTVDVTLQVKGPLYTGKIKLKSP